MAKKFLFNFAASYSGGGFKRLYAFANWFNQNGGASFIVHSHCDFLADEFPNNHFITVNQSKIQRLLNDCDYLDKVRKELGVPDLYYSYGIPIYEKFGKVNWFHLSNVLPLGSKGIPLSLFDKIKLNYLGKRIERNFKNADIIAAESNFSLSMIHAKHSTKFFLSVNGSDDEIGFFESRQVENKDNIAVVVGTYRYKAIEDSYSVFRMLREIKDDIHLVIIGDEKRVPENLRKLQDLILTGPLPQQEVIKYLRKSRYYISTTHIENSYNAASEGIFFADESFISDIGPHRELITDMAFERISIPKINRPMLRVKREDVSPLHLKTWDKVIVEMMDRISAY